MKVELTRASMAEKVLVQRMMELYLYDFSEIDGADLDAEALYGYNYLDQYWLEPARVPLIIRVEGQLAGFVLVCAYSLLGGQGKMIAEFFVMRKYRRAGVGRAAAFAAFNLFPGYWEVSEIAQNVAAQRFWRKVIAEYTGGCFSEVILNDEIWQGPVQVFENDWARLSPG